MVAIPKALALELGFRVGHKAVMENSQRKKAGYYARRRRCNKTVKPKPMGNFNPGTQFIEENGEILDELAIR